MTAITGVVFLERQANLKAEVGGVDEHKYSSLRRMKCDAEFFPRRSRAGCGRDGAAGSRLWGNFSQLSILSSGTAPGFSIAAGDAGAYLLCWGLFTLLGMFVVILCNILVVSEFGWNLDKKTQKQISTAESAST